MVVVGGGNLEDQEKRDQGVADQADEADYAMAGDGLVLDPGPEYVSADALRELIGTIDEEILLADGFDEALIGVATVGGRMIALYDVAKCISILVVEQGMTPDGAAEYFEFNVVNAFVGDKTPAFAMVYRRPYVFEQGDSGVRAFTESEESRKEQLQPVAGDDRDPGQQTEP